MEYDNSRHCLPHAVSYPSYYYDDRAPLAIAHTTRTSPRGYPTGGPVGGLHHRAHMGHEEPMMETGPARRRIAVACARCRKRKIRCSGDTGNGNGCMNCRQAGVDPMQCQFHRVGSDNIHKFMDTRNISQSLSGLSNGPGMASLYSDNALYSRPMTNHPCPQLDTKPVYPSTWTIRFPEETSPVDTYDMDTPGTYLPVAAPTMHTNLFGPSYRWNNPITKPLTHARTQYFDQESPFGAHGLPYIHTNGLPNTAADTVSPLDMSALHLSLPDRPRPQGIFSSDPNAPQRQLPMPQPSPAQASRNVVDQLQDRRLRSVQAIGSTKDCRGIFAKPVLPWNIDGHAQMSAPTATSTDGSGAIVSPTQLPDIANENAMMEYPPTTTTSTNMADTTSTAPQFELNFNTSSLLDAMNASAPAAKYSNFRENRKLPSAASEMSRQSSQAGLYSFNTSNVSKRVSQVGDSSHECTLVSGHRYTPLSHSQPQSQLHSPPGNQNMHRGTCRSHDVPLHRAPISDHNSTF